MEKIIEFEKCPAKILFHLNNQIKHTLKQNAEGSLSKDGMDIALCTFDKTTLNLEYAGANRPLWLLQKEASSENEIIEIKATKFAIGGFTPDNQIFEKHCITLNSGDQIYLSSDGYGDSFGGAKGKKLTTKRMKEILIQSSHLNSEEQKIHMENFMIEWLGNNEQVDDILLIGFTA